MPRLVPRSGVLILPVVLLMATAPSALGAAASITGDDGNPIPLGGTVSIRNMSPQVTFAFAADEQRYSAQIIGPDGQPASSGTSCTRTSSALAERVRFRGNGGYTLILRVTKNPDDSSCTEATEQRAPFEIAARTAIAAPDADRLLTRRPGSFSPIAYDVTVDLNPGADSHELRYARNATIGSDGGIVGPSGQAFVSSSSRSASVTFPRPGRYTLVVRAKVTTADGEKVSPWSPPVVVNAIAPFDFASITLPDSRGPSYRLAAQLREKTAKGRVTVSIGRGRNPARLKRIGAPRIGKNGRISVRFTARRPGIHTLRFRYKGNKLTAGGTIKESFRVYRF